MNLRSKVLPHPLSGQEAGFLPAQTEADTADESGAASETAVAPVRRRSMVVESQVRDSIIVKTVKRWYGNCCQMCGEVLRIPGPAGAYSEGAHILALGHPHNGPDRIENLLCLCPNCHTLFDNGARYLTDDLHVVDAFTHGRLRKLTVVPQHNIETACVRQHREHWTTDDLLAAATSAEPGHNQGL
jgi:predicted restriction endonuclease